VVCFCDDVVESSRCSIVNVLVLFSGLLLLLYLGDCMYDGYLVGYLYVVIVLVVV